MRIIPLADRVLIEPTEVKKKTDSGILLTETEKPTTGTIIAIGANSDCEAKEKDVVMFSQHSGTLMPVNGKECLMMRVSDLIAIVK